MSPEIVVVACPSTTSASDGIFSVYNESDLSLITTVTSTTGLYWIVTDLPIIISKVIVNSN